MWYGNVALGMLALGGVAYAIVIGWMAYALVYAFITDTQAEMPEPLRRFASDRHDDVRYKSRYGGGSYDHLSDDAIDVFCLFKVGIPGLFIWWGAGGLWPVALVWAGVWYTRERYRTRDARKDARIRKQYVEALVAADKEEMKQTPAQQVADSDLFTIKYNPPPQSGDIGPP